MQFCKLSEVEARTKAQLWIPGGSGAGLLVMLVAIAVALFSL